MNITITTDASFMPNQKIGAYAFWISSQMGKYSEAKLFKTSVDSSHDAEFKCIINALHRVKGLKLKVDKIYVNTDSMSCIKTINSGHVTDWCKETLPLYQAIVKELGCKVIMRHIKGHRHTRTPRNWVNDWCDKKAGELARKEKNRIKKLESR